MIAYQCHSQLRQAQHPSLKTNIIHINQHQKHEKRLEMYINTGEVRVTEPKWDLLG
jgi:hypothetical protein